MHRGTWYTLDNTAKIMPSMTNNLNTNVFRLSCTLKSEIDPVILQEALDESIKEFPLFTYTMKNGLFWHYLEKSNKKPKVQKENIDPCAALNDDLLFRLSYYDKRINLEVYHVLSDGNGAMEFLKFIVCTYLSKKYDINTNYSINETSADEKASDDFEKFDKSKFKIITSKSKKSYKLKLRTKENIVTDVIETHMSVSDIKNAAKKYDTTITIYLTALLIDSIIKNARIKDLKRPIGVSLPVDLRHIFPSKTSRNFFYTILVQHKYKEEESLEDIIYDLKLQFKENLTKEHLQNLLNTYMIVQNIILIRIVPSFLKDWILGYISKLGKKGETTVLSNLGIVKVPDDYEKYIECFSAIASGDDLKLTIVSYKDDLVLSFSSHFITKEVERTMVKRLKDDTKNIKIISNIRGDNDEM